jgi:hypothetical protein
VDENFETIDQQYHEFIKVGLIFLIKQLSDKILFFINVKLPTGKLDRKTSIMLEKNDYFIQKTETNANVKINSLNLFYL